MSTEICRWLFLLLFLTTWTKVSNSKEIRVVCYYTNWSVYRPGTAKFSPQNINPYLCTHLIYAFGGFTKENTLKPFDKYQDIEKGGYAKFTGLKTYNKNLKTMLAIGGWNEGSSRFSPMVANPDRRKELIKNAIKFLRQNHFDGLDLDWEYPSFRDGGKSRDRDNYAQLVQEMRQEFERESEKTGRPRLLLTMAVPAGIEYINKGYDVPKLTKYLDWMNILSYDYHSAFEPAVNHHAPLYSLEEPSEYNYDTELNIDYTIKHYLKKGADPNKLVLGIPTYGRSYTLFNPDANEIGAPADGPGDMGEATRENGYLAYYEVCDYIKSQDWEVVQPDPEAMGPYAFKDNQWVGYDDDAVARKKAAYVAENNLGGIMFWSIDNDDFRGNCHGKPYPIIEAAKEALISAYGLTDENLVSPPAKSVKSKTRTRTRSSSKSSATKSEDTEKKVSNSGGSRRRNRVKSKSETSTTSRPKIRRKESRSTTEGTVYSSLELVTPSYTTPAPPPTPGMGGEFKCEDEGFYPHPKDCKKYFWCLSGPGELGIVAHQFTCPAGLYFNKAADSCDYTRNVLCNKKLSRTTAATTTTEASTSKTTATTTARVPPKITAATSRTTVFRTSTTTEAYDDEYEYEDEEEDEEEDNRNSEEDPRVIKELLDLIKKAGGIEELEKQLNIHEDGSASVAHSDATTPSSISKSLVARVLGKAAKNKIGERKNSYSFLNRNSRGPQNDGIKKSEEKEKQERGRLQYTTITRQRTQKSEDDNPVEEEEDEKEETPSRKHTKKQPEYVNIRRGRVSTTTEASAEDSKGQINRNKILGEEGDEEAEIDEEEEEPAKRKTATPQYVNIRRQRPSTTEETSTSKYTVIRRGTTTESDILDDAPSGKKRGTTTPSTDEEISDGKRRSTTVASDIVSSSSEKNDSKSKYKILRRGSTTTEPSTDENGTTLPSKKRGTTSPSVQDVSEKIKTRGTTIASPGLEEKYKILKRGSTTEISTQTEETPSNGSTPKYSLSRTTSTRQEAAEDATTTSGTENPIILQQILITSPESLTIKTTASLSSTNRAPDLSKLDSKLPDSTDVTGEGVYQTQTPQLLEPRPFSLSTSDPTSSLKPVTESSTRVTKVSDPSYKLRLRQKLANTQTDVISTTPLTTEKPTPFRTRAPSRYKQTTASLLDDQTTRSSIKPSLRARKRFSTTTEQYSDNLDESDLNRNFRPSEIADLSSLTAVDFVALKELNNRYSNPSRQRRPRPSTATTTTTTQKTEESLKTGSRTLPLARKLLDGTTFGKSRRVIASKNEHVIEDQINSSSDTTHRIRPFTRSPPNLSVTLTTEATTRATLRNRKIIRRLRPTVSSKAQSQNEDENRNQIVFKKRLVRPGSTTPATETENLIENASSNSLFNRRFTRPSSTAGEVNKLTTTEGGQKTTTQLSKEDEQQNETSDDVSAEEGENIRLSESNIRENSNVNNHNVLNSEDGKKVRRKILKRIRNKVEDEKATTEPNIIIRTRKIIRKLTPTESTILSTSTTTESIEGSTAGRKRKIIRRLRPTTDPSESATETTTANEKTLFIRGRPFLPREKEKTLDIEDIESPAVKTETKHLESISKTNSELKFKQFKSKYATITRTTTPRIEELQEEHDEEDSKEDIISTFDRTKYKTFSRTTTKSPGVDTLSQRTIDRSKYSAINRGTTSTTEIYEFNNSEEENDDEELNTQSRPKYRIYRPTIFHEEDDEEVEDEKEDDEENTNSPKYRVLHPNLGTTEQSEDIEDDAIKIRVLRPTTEHNVPEIEIATNANTNETSNSQTDKLQYNEPSVNVETSNKEDLSADLIEPTEDSVLEESTTQSEEQNNEDEKEQQNEENTDEEGEQNITTTTTVRNYINPILSRQKNRPAFVRPKLTIQNPSRTTAVNKPKYKSFSRTTSRPNKVHVDTEDNHETDSKKAERKFVPKSFSRTKYLQVGHENRTETVSQNTSPTSSIETKSTTDNYYNTTTEYGLITSTESNNSTETVESTSLFTEDNLEIYNNTNVIEDKDNEANFTTTESTKHISEITEEHTLNTTTSSDDITNDDTVFNATDVETVAAEITTLKTTDITTGKNLTEDILEESTINYSDTSTESANGSTTETTRTYHSITTSASTELSTNETTINYNDIGTENVDITTTETTLSYQSSTTVSSNESELNETTINYKDTSTSNADTTPETTPVYLHKSTLRSRQNRPKYNVPKRLTSTESTITATRASHRFNQRNRGQTTKSRLITPSLRSTTPSSSSRNKFIYKYSTTERNRFVTEEKIVEPQADEYDEIVGDDEDDVEEEIKEEIYTPRTPSSYTPGTYTTKSKPRVSNRPEGHTFRKTTETSKVTEDLGDIDREAVKNRNKNLFSKKRKMNTPFGGNTQSHLNATEEKSEATATTQSTTQANPITIESVTKSAPVAETTEYLTTLHHIFAETELNSDKGTSTTESTTVSTSENVTDSTKSKVEKLIEVNRIVEVHDINNTDMQKDNKVIDKIGVINRVTVVKVVDGNPSPEENEISETTTSSSDTTKNVDAVASEIATVKEIPNDKLQNNLHGFTNLAELIGERQDRKFEIYGGSQVIDYSSKDVRTGDKGNAEIIDGSSNINIITPRPYYSTEASTISLEALFQTDTPQKLNNINANLLKPSNDDEILETGNSRYVNVRILGQDKEVKDESQIVPIMVPKEDDYITMKAEVVEVTPKTSREIIKIVPIQVEMSRKLILPSDFNMKYENGVPKVNFQILKTESSN